MIRLKHLALSAFLLFNLSTARSQNHPNNGYFVDLNQDTVQCYLEAKITSKSFQKISVNVGGKEKNLDPLNTLGYGFDNTHFRPIQADSSFALVLVDGEMTLLSAAANKTYHIIKNSEYALIDEKEKFLKKDGKDFMYKDQRWKGKLTALSSDCKTGQKDYTLSDKGMISYAVTYNNCKNQRIKYVREIAKNEFLWGTYTAVSFFNVTFKNSSEVPSSYRNTTFESVTPMIGLTARYIMNSNQVIRYSIISGIQFSSNLKGYEVDLEPRFPAEESVKSIFKMNIKRISIPFSIGPVFDTKLGKFHVNFGYRLNFAYDWESTRELVQVISGETLSSTIRPIEIGNWGNFEVLAGYEIPVKTFRLAVQYELALIKNTAIFTTVNNPMVGAQSIGSTSIRESRISLSVFF
ncbi:MAG: hypothetical protein ABJG47_15905 [Ekhidna sp.]